MSDSKTSTGTRMSDRVLLAEKARTFFETLWKRGDPWELEGSEFEHAKYRRQFSMVAGRRYRRVLEIGCGAGVFTGTLQQVADTIVAIDISPTAIAQARARCPDATNVDFRVANIMDDDLGREGPWDLVVISETIYYLGWLYSFFDVAWLAAELYRATREGGQLLMANTYGGVDDYLLRPWAIRTYRDLFLNVGYELASEDIFRGNKNGADLEVLISVFARGAR